MISLDTNVMIRFIVRDEPSQYRLACELIQRAKESQQRAMVMLLVVLECEWVLRSAYRYSKSEIITTFSALRAAGEVQIEREAVLVEALEIWAQGKAHFANCLILASSRALGCTAMMTFDRQAGKLPGATLLRRSI